MKKARSMGWYSFKLYAANQVGIPDRLFLKKGGLIAFIEFKRPGEKPRKIQEYWHRILVTLGFPMYTVDNAQAAIDALNEVENGIS